VLGPKTIRRIHRSIGDEVTVSVVGVQSLQFKIVGIGVVPTTGHTANLGEGSIVIQDGVEHFFPGDPRFSSTVHDEFAARFRPGVSEEAARARLTTKLADTGAMIAAPTTPGDLLNFGRSKDLPLILSGLLALLALGTLAHALITSINRRRRDLAICKTLGFTRGDVARAVAWQSSTFIVVSLAFGLLVGVIAGRWLWGLYARQLGILSVPRVPAWTLVLMVPAAGLLANGLALLPARSAAATRPALVLRTE
jgi:predicted lysophospholipase L1 biosynthesis ABC-type transport system permease subunit